MFCSSCGSQIKDGAKFCGNCGAPVRINPAPNSVQPPENITPASNPSQAPADIMPKPNHTIVQSAVPLQQPDDQIKAILARNTTYYMRQFDTILSHGKGKLNWASFFLSFFHAAYRSMWREWLQYLKIPLCTEIIGVILALIGTFATNGIIIIASILFSVVGGLAIFIRSIMFAMNFNRFYAKHVEAKKNNNDFSSDLSLRNVIITGIIFVILAISSTALSSAAMISALVSVVDEPLPYEPSDFSFSDSYASEPNTTDNTIYHNNGEPTITPNELVSIYDYVGDWTIESLDTETSFATFTIENQNDHFILNIDAVFRNGDKIVAMEGVELSFDGTKAIGSYDEDGWGNSGYITLYFDGDYIYANITAEGGGEWDLAMNDERCVRYEPEDYLEYYDNTSEYLYPSDRQYITTDELDLYTHEEIVLIRNEIYARHGYIFQTTDIQNYFASKSWYYPNSNYDESLLNSIEKANIDTIVEYEKAMGWRS